MTSKGITETRDLLIAIGGLVRGGIEANADGKVSVWEGVKLGLSNLGPVIEACSGISEVPAELMDLQPEELDALYPDVMVALGWSTLEQARNIFDTLFAWARGSLVTFITLKNLINPPRAVIVNETPA